MQADKLSHCRETPIAKILRVLLSEGETATRLRVSFHYDAHVTQWDSFCAADACVLSLDRTLSSMDVRVTK